LHPLTIGDPAAGAPSPSIRVSATPTAVTIRNPRSTATTATLSLYVFGPVSGVLTVAGESPALKPVSARVAVAQLSVPVRPGDNRVLVSISGGSNVVVPEITDRGLLAG
jgi:hypothetical protein